MVSIKSAFTVIMADGKPRHGSSDKSEIREWKREQGFEMLKKGMKKSKEQ